MPNFLDRLLYGRSMSEWDLSLGKYRGAPREMKTAYEVIPVGIQGRPQYPKTDIAGLQKVYTRNEIVYSAIEIRAVAGMDPALHVQERTKDGDWQPIEGHPMRRLLMEPNEELDEAGLFRAFSVSMDTAGVFYGEIVRGSNRLPIAIHPLNPAKTAPVPDSEGVVTEYEFREGSKRVRIPAEDMIVKRHASPQNKYQPLSPLAVCLGTVDADNAQTDYLRSFFNNAGVPSGLLKILNRQLTPERQQEIRNQWEAKYGRATGNLHSLAILDENAEYQKIGANLDELESKELRLFTETRQLMTFGVPPLVLYAYAGLEKATYSNLQEAWKWFWSTTLGTLFTEYRRWLTRQLLTQFVDKELILGERIRLAYDFSEVKALREDEAARHQRARDNFRAGGITLNEYRSKVGEKADPTGDYYLRPAALVPVFPQEVTPITTEAQAALKRYIAARSVPQAILSLPGQQVKLLPAPASTKKAATRARIQGRMQSKMEKFIMGQYEAIAKAVEAAA